MKSIIRLFVVSIFYLCVIGEIYAGVVPAKPAHQLRVTTFNINWGEKEYIVKNPQSSVTAIKIINADVVLLQETTPFWQHLINKQLKNQYPYQEFRHEPNAGGLAILSKYPFKTKIYINPKIGWHPGWIINTNTPFGKIQMLNLHLCPPLASNGSIGFLGYAVFKTPGLRVREAKYFYSMLNPKMPTIIAGDFNEGDIGRAVHYFQATGLIDAIKLVRLRQYTWHWKEFGLKFNDRYDRFFYSTKLRLTHLQVLQQGDSDHYPVFADFALAKSRMIPS